MAHDASQVTSHPEITIPDYSTLRSLLQAHIVQAETSVNVVELQRTVDGSVDDRRLENLDHEALVHYLEKSNGQEEQPALRILFLNNEELSTDDPPLGASVDQVQVALNPATIDYLVQSLGVSPIFLSTITTVPWLLDTGNALFKTYDSDIHHASNISSIQGFFRLSDRGRPSHVWFKHDIVNKATTYIIQGCPQRVMDVLNQWTEDKTLRKHLLRPLALESLLIDEVTWTWSKAIVDNAKKLLEYEHFSKEDNADRIDTAVHALHNLSQHFHILQEELNGIIEQLDYLISVHQLVSSASFRTQSSSTGGAKNTSVADSLQFLRSRTHNWQRWVNNWKERTNIRIHLFFNLATQRDNGTNASIAHFTSDIATETHKDSSAMMTIAILTLVFLPGTFIAAVLSMPMVEQSVTSAGAGWKLYVAVTIPLTVVVILAWNLWRRFRNTRQSQKHVTSSPAPEAPPLNSLDFDALPSRTFGGKIKGIKDPFGDEKPDHNDPTYIASSHPYNLKIHIPPRSPLSDSPTPSFPLALSKALSQIDSRGQLTSPTSKSTAFRSKFRSISRRRTNVGARVGHASAPASIKNRTRSSSPAAFMTYTQSQTPASASPMLMRRDEPTSGRTVLDPNSPPFEGYGMWAPDPIHEPFNRHSGRSTDYIPLAQITQRTSTTRSRFSSRRQSRGSGIPSRRSSRRSSPMVRGSTSRRSSLLRSRPQSNVATPARHSPAVLPGRTRSNSALNPGEVRFAPSLPFERGRSPTRSAREGWSSSPDSAENLASALRSASRRQPSVSSRGSLGINLHTPSPAPSQRLTLAIPKSHPHRTPSSGPSPGTFEDPHPVYQGGGWTGETTSPLIPIQQLPPPFAAIPSVMPLASSNSVYYDAPSTPLVYPFGFPLFGQQPPSPRLFSSLSPWTSQFQRQSPTPFDGAYSTGADPTAERLADTSRKYPVNPDPSPTEGVPQRPSSRRSKRHQRPQAEDNDADDELGEDSWLSY